MHLIPHVYFCCRHDAFFRDYSLVPLMVQQNYLPALQSSREKGDKIDRMRAASEALSDNDLVDAMLHRDNNWSLLPLHASLTVRVGTFARGGVGFPSFPEWLGKHSARNKRKRLVNVSALCSWCDWGRSTRMQWCFTARSLSGCIHVTHPGALNALEPDRIWWQRSRALGLRSVPQVGFVW